MKKFVSVLLSCILLFACLSAFAACKKDTPPGDGDSDAEINTDLTAL